MSPPSELWAVTHSHKEGSWPTLGLSARTRRSPRGAAAGWWLAWWSGAGAWRLLLSGSRSIPRRCASGGTAGWPAARRGLRDRSSRPRHCPWRTPEATRSEVIGLRWLPPVGADHIAHETGLAASTVQKNILNAAGLGRLDRSDRAAAPARRCGATSGAAGRAAPRRRQKARGDPRRRRLVTARQR